MAVRSPIGAPATIHTPIATLSRDRVRSDFHSYYNTERLFWSFQYSVSPTDMGADRNT